MAIIGQPITPAQLAEIRQRAEASSTDYWADDSYRFWFHARADVLALCAEV
ncbi:MAG: hypothetical protein L0177_06480 [Chloroflexi bacterium]|nr:hypothetical protein [Chloroflexota bacterium]